MQLELEPKKQIFLPGERIEGKVRWQFRFKREKTKDLELMLMWFTEGAGNTDIGIPASQRFLRLPTQGEKRFSFIAPSAPQSFVGKLFRLRWAIEVKADTTEVDRVEFDITTLPAPANVERGLS